MIYKFKYLAIAIGLFISSCSTLHKSARTASTLPATALQPYGRYLLNEAKDLELISSAVHFGFSFRGKECQLFASINNVQGHNYLQYELDGVYQKRIKISGNSKEPIVITAPTEGKHVVWIYKAKYKK
jgi:hypothetical protein